ncbi:hypothetical protein ACVGVM_25065 [Pseudonocardia bannensis]|uniref:Uncharacterized protein n=1 Tax=Pseudonocardia bannensis TaxID=630973 RepID=A0A848DD75_9PSEU|nr:hypothetical protein [Pseudonocardia bannensis]NMH90535.1 hypothetical protein [Pseudonocardia bannensis]
MGRTLQRLGALVRDVGYGIHAGNAIRHGLPAPEGVRRRPSAPPDRPGHDHEQADVLILYRVRPAGGPQPSA